MFFKTVNQRFLEYVSVCMFAYTEYHGLNDIEGILYYYGLIKYQIWNWNIVIVL